MPSQHVKTLMRKARLTNAKRDVMERGVGFSSPVDGGKEGLLRTAMTALDAGMKMSDWTCVAEAQAMLEELHIMIHPTGAAYRIT